MVHNILQRQTIEYFLYVKFYERMCTFSAKFNDNCRCGNVLKRSIHSAHTVASSHVNRWQSISYHHGNSDYNLNEEGSNKHTNADTATCRVLTIKQRHNAYASMHARFECLPIRCTGTTSLMPPNPQSEIHLLNPSQCGLHLLRHCSK